MPLTELLKEDRDYCIHRMRDSHRKVLKRYPNQLFVAGGFIRSCISNEKINDIDLFASTPDKAREIAAVVRAFEGKAQYETANAITIRTQPFATQFIHRWTFANPEECIQSFDFTIAKSAIWWDGTEWKSACDLRFYPDLAAKRLIYCSPVREEAAGGSMLRVLKFYRRGYRIPMDSLGAVIGRIAAASGDALMDDGDDLDSIITGLLKEVDPDIDPDHESHLPTTDPNEPAF